MAVKPVGAIIQEDSDGVRILRQASQSKGNKPLFELGAKVDFRGNRWQIIGFMVRSDAEGEYLWREYLLFNPYRGYRFLTEADGHWNLLAMTKVKPHYGEAGVNWSGKNYRRFYKGEAKVRYVLGEFYWRVKVGDRALVEDYVAPPFLLSSETSHEEIVWTAGSYVEPQEIVASFKVLGSMPKPQGVSPCQPSPYKAQLTSLSYHWLGFVFLIFILQALWPRAGSRELFSEVIRSPETGLNQTVSTESFEIEKDGTNLEIELFASLSNSWLGVLGTMVPEDNQGQRFSFQRELSRYDDVNDNEEAVNNSRAELFFPKMAKGKYHLELNLQVDPLTARSQAASHEGNQISVAGHVNPFQAMPLALCLVLVSLYPLWFYLRHLSFENNRWAASNPYGGNS